MEPKFIFHEEDKFYTKVVTLAMQMLDRKPSEEPVSIVEEDAVDDET